MLSPEEIKKQVQSRLSSHRYQHTNSVAETALKFAKRYQAEFDEIDESYLLKIELAALLHDSCKELKNSEQLTLAEFYGIEIFPEDKISPNLLHARVGAAWIEEEFDILDPHILLAVRDHTFGSENMLLSSKILFLADMLEPLRDKSKTSNTLAGLRAKIDINTPLDEVLLEAMNAKIEYVLKKNQAIHPLGIKARNAILQRLQVN